MRWAQWCLCTAGAAALLLPPTPASPTLTPPSAAPPTSASTSQQVPPLMRGTWKVVRNLSERSLGCFDPAHARELIGMHVVIREQHLVWNHLVSEDLAPEPVEMTSDIFQARYGKQPQDLGLAKGHVTIVNVRPTEGIPVNALVQLDASTLLIDACNIWLETRREEKSSVP